MSEAATKLDIVVGVDGSDESFAALKWALEEASLTGQSVNAGESEAHLGEGLRHFGSAADRP